jgi:replication factor C subunit 3/5
MVKVMKYVASRQNFSISDEGVIREIAQDAEGNLRKALLVFEALKMQTFVNRPLLQSLDD